MKFIRQNTINEIKYNVFIKIGTEEIWIGVFETRNDRICAKAIQEIEKCLKNKIFKWGK